MTAQKYLPTPSYSAFQTGKCQVFSPLSIQVSSALPYGDCLWNDQAKGYQVLVDTLKTIIKTINTTQGIKFGSSLMQHH